MKDKEILIKIQVCGLCATGKTSISKKLGQILKSEGFEVTLIDDDYTYAPEHVDKNLKAISAKTHVTIEAIQLRKAFNL